MLASNKAFNKVLVPAQTPNGPLSKKLIEKEIRRAAKLIEASYGPFNGDTDTVPVVVSVLFGAIHIHPLLMESFSVGFPMYPAMIRAKSYESNEKRGDVEISDLIMEKNVSIAGRRVLIVDDIIESGQTLHALKEWFENEGASDVRCFTLLSKPDKRVYDVEVDWTVFNLTPGQWVVGKGLDDNGLYRHFPNIVVLRDSRESSSEIQKPR
ncbi:phosphoribosyltransferase [Lignipirellula cremea]|uniref:Hypoxanthine-guanine phosphoribosyltransferase n=1 Tax=Lignipirellula cremea TaxID=2528010 RepID=A0A518DWK8_9BACT|nr:phosphoribosyltransferase family protein [Lignipirellula cremea]QDU96213.1 Hypoxanthine-guanine phosphoribosyltransferase [Lignipirellula cremea]